MATKKKLLQAAAGNAGGAGLNVEDVFSTYLYTGTGATLNIVNGIDLAGEGGLVWHKYRGGTSDHGLFDTERGVSRKLTSNGNSAQTAAFSGYGITAFNSNGYTLGTQYSGENGNGNEVVSWTFRKAPKFFDVVTYTGNGVAGRTISHNLGSVPGCIMVKRTNSANSWNVYHRGIASDAETDYLTLDLTSAAIDSSGKWNDTAPTSSVFTVGPDSTVNANGGTYVAYLFAHNDGDGEFGPDADADAIKCGSYTGNGTSASSVKDVDLGFEPQWLLIKRTDTTRNWVIYDVMRGMASSDYGDPGSPYLIPNLTNAESDLNIPVYPTATGFTVLGSNSLHNATGGNYIYIAIRRPTAVPESGTEVFGLNEYTGNNTAGRLITSSGTGVVDAAFINSSGSGSRMASRLTGIPFLTRNDTSAEINSNTRFENFDDMNGFFVGSNSQVNSSSYTYLAAMWTRAPNYFDVVAYTGDGAATQDINHNLGVSPEMIWVKRRDASGSQWPVWHSGNPNYSTYLNTNLGSYQTTGGLPNYVGQNVSSTTFRVSTDGSASQSNGSGATYIAYLFATLPGVSKVGSYTGNGSSQTINCGFTSGARYVLVKRTNTTGDWVEFNSEYGIVAGNEKAWRVNAGGDTGTSLDLIDPNSSGFIINQEASYNLNVNNSNYIFYAIA